MGLDAVELVLEIEQTFSIQLPDDEVARMRTVGDVYDFILASKYETRSSSVCLSAGAFYALRRAARALGVTCRLRPRDTTAALLPLRGRRRFWAELQRVAGLTVPQLERAPWLVWACAGAVVVLSVGVGIALHRAVGVPVVSLAGLGTAAASAVLLAVLTRPFAVHPAKHCRTLRGLAEATLARNFERLADKYRGAQANDVWLALRAIIVEQLGVSPDVVTPTASFVKDLGCG